MDDKPKFAWPSELEPGDAFFEALTCECCGVSTIWCSTCGCIVVQVLPDGTALKTVRPRKGVRQRALVTEITCCGLTWEAAAFADALVAYKAYNAA